MLWLRNLLPNIRQSVSTYHITPISNTHLKARLDVFAKPHHAGRSSHPIEFICHAGLRQDTCCLVLHVAVHHDGVLDVALVGVDPIFT